MKAIIKYGILFPLLLASGKTFARQLNNLKAGPYKVGFRSILRPDGQGKPLLICLWYPASAGGEKMTLKNYIVAGALSKDVADTASTNGFKRVLELPFLFHLDKVPDDQYAKVLAMPLKAGQNAVPIKKRFPLVIASASPGNYPVTFEYLASNGFVVASITAKVEEAPNDTLLWPKPTDRLEYLLNYMIGQPDIDTTRVAAFGHGGGIQPAFYLAMRTTRVKLLINMDGGVFGDRSKTTLSPDYKPAMLKVPMLHIITVSQQKEDNARQLKVLSNPIYRVVIRSDEVQHHDFTMWGVVVAEALHKRGASTKIVEEVYSNIHSIILYFLEEKKLDTPAINSSLFDYSLLSPQDISKRPLRRTPG